MIKTYDLIVVGGGTGGLRLSLAVARMGKRTLLIESQEFGGTCLNNGCIPTKAMLEAAHRYHDLNDLKEFGISVSKSSIDIKHLLKRVNRIVADGQYHIKKGFRHSKLEVVQGKGIFVDKKIIRVGSESYTAKKIVIATGASNNVPPVQGIEKVTYITNENILLMKALPKSIVMIGAGYISMEFATFFNFLGVKVTMIEYADEILSMLDEDVVHTLEHYYSEKGIKIKKHSKVIAVQKKGKLVDVYYEDVHSPTEKPLKVSAEQLFVATGRSPNTRTIGLEKTGVKVGKHNEVIVEDTLETNVKGIYAMGDVLGKAMFAHAVKRESEIILHNLFHRLKKSMDFSLVPWAVFTDPVIAGIGLSENEAVEKEIDYRVLHANFKHVGRATIINDTRGFLKILYDPITCRIFGACVIGPQADVIIHEVIALMNSNNPCIDVIKKAIHIHPTLSEIMTVLH